MQDQILCSELLFQINDTNNLFPNASSRTTIGWQCYTGQVSAVIGIKSKFRITEKKQHLYLFARF